MKAIAHTWIVFCTVAVILLLADSAQAGMPAYYMLTDVGKIRMEALSFFLFLFCVSAYGFYLLWNQIQPQFPSLPKLGFLQAAGVIVAWGLAFNLVLAMISGVRESISPGVWEKKPGGISYQIKADSD